MLNYKNLGLVNSREIFKKAMASKNLNDKNSIRATMNNKEE
jgi:hypothetical protein